MKYALLIGINYKNTNHQLNGCINDVMSIGYILENTYNYSINYMTDDTEIKPTRNDILYKLNELFNNINDDDTILIYFSGHGTYFKDINNDEIDNQDEALFTIDSKIILDDDLNNLIQNNDKKFNIKMFFDCCHSGTLVDLEYNFKYLTKTNKYELIENKNIVNKNIVLFSGCLDSQSSSDSFFNKSMFKEYKNHGAFTYCLLEIFNEIGNLKVSNRNVLKMLSIKLENKKFEQIPQFSCSTIKSLDDYFL